MFRTNTILSGIFLLLLFIPQAHATPISWSFQDALFDDGGAINGSILYDSDTSSFLDWDISVTGGDLLTFPEFTYNNLTSSSSVILSGDPEGIFLFSDLIPNRQLRITATELLDGSLASVALAPGGGFGTLGGEECFNCSPFRLITGGSLLMASVPEPPVLLLMAMGGGIFLSLRKLGARRSLSA